MAVATSLLRILVVDDNATARDLIRRMLERIGVAAVVEAPNGMAGIECLKREPVDLVICDWGMPEMSGIEMLRAVRAEYPRLPFIMLTGRVDAASVMAAKLQGVSAYLGKPVSLEELKAKVRNAVAGLSRP